MSALYYFAYGSNMSARVFSDRVSATSIGPALLRDWRLAFSLPSKRWGGRAADIARVNGAAVWGRLWHIARDEMVALDQYERNYRRIDVTVEHFEDSAAGSGERVRAATYVVRDELRAATEGFPAPEYRARMLDGARECDLPEHYTSFLRSVKAGPARETEHPTERGRP